MRMIETSITEIKNSLLPFVHLKEYKDKEKELQESIKKYDTTIQAKKQKKFKRDVMDYKNSNVYKWQIHGDSQDEQPDDPSMEEESEEPILLPPLGMMGGTPRRVDNIPYSPTRLITPNIISERRDNRRDDYRGPPNYRTPSNNRYNIPVRNRYSPLRDDYRGQHPGYRRGYEGGRDFPRVTYQDKPPGKWRPHIPYRNPGWRGRNAYGGPRPRDRYWSPRRTEGLNTYQRYEINPQNGTRREHQQETNMGPIHRHMERESRQEGDEVAGRRKRPRNY